MKHIVRRLLKLLTPFWQRVLLSVVLGFATIASGVGLMTTSAYIIAKAALHPSIAELQIAIVGVRFFGIARGFARYLERLVSHDVSFRLLGRLRVQFYAALEPLAPARLLSYRSGDLLSRVISDIETLKEFYVRVIAPPIVALLLISAMAVFMGSFTPQSTLALIACLLMAGAAVPVLIQQLAKPVGHKLISARAQLEALLVDSVQGLADLLAFSQETQQKKRVQAAHQRLIQAQSQMAKLTGLQTALGILLQGAAVIVVLLLAIPRVHTGQLDGVMLAVIVLAVIASFEATAPLPAAAQHLGASLAAARRLFEIVDTVPIVEDPPQPMPKPKYYDLTVRNLYFCYPYADSEAPTSIISLSQDQDRCFTSLAALQGISFYLPQHGRIALLGPSGAGKTTLVNLLLRFWEYDAGEILLGGHHLKSYHQQDVRRVIAIVSQNTYLFSGTIRENLLLARPEATPSELIRAAQQAQIHDVIQQLPQGYETHIGEWGLRLSGGEQQRLAIARALLKDAPLLILDEPTANLDSLTEYKVMQTLLDLMGSRTTLLITHRLVGMEAMDEILVLCSGRIIERGRHQDLIQLQGLYRRMWEQQRYIDFT